MPFRVSGRNMDIADALRTRVRDRVTEAVAKYFDRGYSGQVTVGKDGSGFRAECAIHLDSGITLQAEAMAADAFASADQAVDRIEKRLRRYNRRLRGRMSAHASGARTRPEGDAQNYYVIAAPDHESEEEVTDFNPIIIQESTTTLERLSVSEAVMELDMTGAPVVTFRHAATGRVNIVYRRGDGNVGWVDPPAAQI
jgi:ribosomal subunit interface protein